MTNILTAAELKRRGMAAIEDGLRRGPIHIVKHNKPAAVVLSEEEYRRLTEQPAAGPPGLTALQWLLALPAVGVRDKQQMDEALASERSW